MGKTSTNTLSITAPYLAYHDVVIFILNLSNLLTLNIPGEGYSGNERVVCTKSEN